MKQMEIDDYLELIGQLIDIFEDYLEEKGIEPYKTEEPYIYATDYDKLKNQLGDTLVNWGLIKIVP